MRIPLKSIEKCFTFFALQLFTGAVLPLVQEKAGLGMDLSQGDLVTQAFFYVVYLVTFFLIVARWKLFIRNATKNKLLWLLVGIVLISALWSVVPDLTLRRSFAMVGTTLFGVYLGTRYNLKEQLHLLAWTLGTGAVFSILLVITLPSYGTMGGLYTGAWQGIYGHKNTLGQLMVISALVFLLLSMSSSRRIWVARAGFGLSVSLLLLANSKSSLVVLLTLLILLPFCKALQQNYTMGTILFIILMILVGGVANLLVSNLETILGAFGRDATLTGRTDIWGAVLDKIKERPWLGYGYKVFWLSQHGEADYVWNANPWRPNHAHNGFLELTLDLGLLGLLVFVLGFLSAYLGALICILSVKTAVCLWPLLYLTFMLLTNLSESSLLRQNNIYWVLYVAVICSTSNNIQWWQNLKFLGNYHRQNKFRKFWQQTKVTIFVDETANVNFVT